MNAEEIKKLKFTQIIEVQKERLNWFRNLFVPILLLFIATFARFVQLSISETNEPSYIELILLLVAQGGLFFILVYLYYRWADCLGKIENIKID